MYQYYTINRNPLFHATPLPENIVHVRDYETAKLYINDILTLIDEAFYLNSFKR